MLPAYIYRKRSMSSIPEAQTDVWVKWDWLWKALFYGSVLVSVVLMLFDRDRTTSIWAAGLLTALLVIWHWGGLRLAYQGSPYRDDRALFRFAIILGDMFLWFVLVNISPAYYFVLFGLFSQVFRHLPVRFAVPSAVFLMAAIYYLEVTESGEPFSLANPIVWVFVLLTLGGIVLGVWVSRIIDQSVQRRHLIEQLEAAQADLAAAERREGVLEERQRLAREIHDTLAQGFTSIVMHLEAAEQALPDDLDTLQKHVDRARATARTNLDEARRVVQNLRPDELETHPLPDAIERTARRWTDETGIDVDTAITGVPVSLHPDLEVTLLRATQEALNNVRKHAQATSVQLTLSYMEDVVILDVQDDGQGLGSAEAASSDGGYGLQAMQERAQQRGGSVTIESDPGEGTTLVLSIPIAD